MNGFWEALGPVVDLNVPSYLDGPVLLVALAAFGAAVGVLTGLFGVGGGFLLTPLLKVVFGIPYDVVIGSSLSFTIGTAASGAARHMRKNNFEPRSMLVLAISAVAGAVLGAVVNRQLKLVFGDRSYTLVLHAMFIAMLLLTAWLTIRPAAQDKGQASLLQRLRLGPYIDLPLANLPRVSVPGLVAVGLLIGVLKGLLGIGGGVLFMPLLIVVVGLTPHQAVGTSLGVVVFSSMAGTIKYGLDGKANLWVVMSLLVGSAVGVQIGAKLCERLHGRRLRSYFAALVLVVTVMIAADFAKKLITG